MEHEEREEIPWSSLIPADEAGIDRRWYAAGIGVAVLVLGIVGWRLVSGQPSPDPVSAPVPAAVEVTTTTEASEPQLIVAESSLVRPVAEVDTREQVARAEWFSTTTRS